MLNWSTDDSRVSLSGMRWVRSVPRVGRLATLDVGDADGRGAPGRVTAPSKRSRESVTVRALSDDV